MLIQLRCIGNLFPQLRQDAIRHILDTVVKNSDSNTSEDKLKMMVMQRLVEENLRKNTKKTEKEYSSIASGSLLIIYNEAIKKKIHPYDLFKENGFIKDPLNEFLKVK